MDLFFILFSMNKQQTKAFTLVELIVVITILAIFWTIAFISLQGYSRDSRDSVRISDISNIRTSLELFHLNAGKYPLPDDSETVTYSGGILWYQGTVGDQVVSNLSRNMSEVPTDPLTDKQYFYSVHNNKNENQVLALLEGDVSALNYWTDVANAASLAVTPRLDGNYNGLFVKNSSSIVPIPSIMTAEDTTGGLVLSSSNIGSMITHLWDNIPSVGNVISNTGALTGLNFSPYNGTITSDSTDSDKVALMDAIVTAYSGSSLENNGIIKDALSKSWTGELTAFVDTTLLWDATTKTTASSNEETVEYNPEYSVCTWTGQFETASTTYPSCNTADIIVCTWDKTWYRLAACNMWSNTANTSQYNYTIPSSFTNFQDWWVDGTETYTATYQNQPSWDQTKMQWPCESWYHVPTYKEWYDVHQAWWWGEVWNDMMNDLLLPRLWEYNTVVYNLYDNGAWGWYWTSSPNLAINHQQSNSSTYQINIWVGTSYYQSLAVRCFHND